MANYRVEAPYVLLKMKDSAGQAAVNGLYQGAIVSDEQVDKESLKRHLGKGMVKKVAAAATVEPPAPPPSDDQSSGGTSDDQQDAGPKKPAQNDPKDAWVEYAATQGVDLAEAEGLSKTDLIELYK